MADNALDAGAKVSLGQDGDTWIVDDDGPGLDPAAVPRLFAVNRPLRSTKLVRRPTRGMLGNGLRIVMGAVAATKGSLVVETRGHRLTLAMCKQTGHTLVEQDEPIPRTSGLTIYLTFGKGDPSDGEFAAIAIAAATWERGFTGSSSPHWYGATDLHRLFAQVTPSTTTVAEICRHSLGCTIADERPARDLSLNETRTVLYQLRANTAPVPPKRLGPISKGCWPALPSYSQEMGVVASPTGASVPFIVEVWASCSRPSQRGQGNVAMRLMLNRSMTVAPLRGRSLSDGLDFSGCGLDHVPVFGPKAGD